MSEMLIKLNADMKQLRKEQVEDNKAGQVDPTKAVKLTVLQTLIGELDSMARTKNSAPITDATVYKKIADTLTTAKDNYDKLKARGDNMFKYDVEIALLGELMPKMATVDEMLAVIDEALAANLPPVIKDRKVLNPIRGKIVAALNAKLGNGKYDAAEAARLAVARINAVPLTE